ncbi:hypothetical protein D9756_009309 [Leucocoprinus leucothites]|uniref:Uncharacterized protein n=1 Tax=Leucocoprinus leucothites TaxID=201217 RepID=A0A8H5CXR6_9AGAR|nr:hypothetical protein D9756_009309 [Leucoagaricus leucothites]
MTIVNGCPFAVPDPIDQWLSTAINRRFQAIWHHFRVHLTTSSHHPHRSPSHPCHPARRPATSPPSRHIPAVPPHPRRPATSPPSCPPLRRSCDRLKRLPGNGHPLPFVTQPPIAVQHDTTLPRPVAHHHLPILDDGHCPGIPNTATRTCSSMSNPQPSNATTSHLPPPPSANAAMSTPTTTAQAPAYDTATILSTETTTAAP